MTETQQRIKAYQEALPHLKEKVFGVAVLLMMSITMMISATLAWVVLSTSPEVTGVSTTVAANGNLEIALVPEDGSEPAQSEVGDSGKDVVARNITWGNLVNLADDSYGLQELALRPAQLNTTRLLDSPLFGAVYSMDGRIERLTSNFGFATWVEPEGNVPGYFIVSDKYGARAISSTKIEAVGAAQQYIELVEIADGLNGEAGTEYKKIADNNAWMSSLATFMGSYITVRMNSSDASLNNPTCATQDIINIRDMYQQFIKAFEKEAEAMAALLNIQAFLNSADGTYEEYEGADIFTLTEAQLASAGMQLSELSVFQKDYKTLNSDIEKLNTIINNGGTILWKDSGMNAIVNNLVNVGICEITNDSNPTPLAVNDITVTAAMDYVGSGKNNTATINNGILYNYEKRSGTYIFVPNMKISAKVKRSGITVSTDTLGGLYANIETNADDLGYSLFGNDMAYSQSLNDGDYGGGQEVAEDTYGLAVDLWVRTNVKDSYLTLEGNILTETETVRATGKDGNGNDVELWTYTATDEDGNSYTVDVYQDAQGNWYNATAHAIVDLTDITPVAKYTEIATVIGFEGENRVWEDAKAWEEGSTLSVNSTTQGSGSCYIYYAETPEDQARSLQLLEAMNVVFVDENGEDLAYAEMDVDHYYAENGKVIVPLVLRSDSIAVKTDAGDTYAITALEQNVPTRITALVYLDGNKLFNDSVLSAADIQGQLNIQFGSSVKLNHATDEELELAEYSISASVDKTEFDYDTATGPMTTKVSVVVSGADPSTVQAFFMRAVNATQGSREDMMTFTKGADGTWTSDYTFTTPGTYVLRSVRLDGVDYDLDTCPTVTVKGFDIESLTCQEADTDRHISIMTADSIGTVHTSLKFATNDPEKMPDSVMGRFMTADGTVSTIKFTYNSTNQTWSGSSTFNESGEYTLQYLILDGEYVEIREDLQVTATVYLGMNVAIYTTSPTNFKYLPSEMTEDMKNLGLQVVIKDDTGNKLLGLQDVKLYYAMKGNGVKGMDTDLTWNGTTGYYEGSLKTIGAGVFQFNRVQVGENTITVATIAPTFTIASPEPPEYIGHNTVAYKYVPNADALMNVQVSYSVAASMSADIVNLDTGEITNVTGSVGNYADDEEIISNWNFAVPKDASGYQDGNWQLTTIYIWDAYDKDGNEYTEEAPLVIDVVDTNNVTKVVNRLTIKFPENKSQNFTGVFMEEHTISGLSVDIVDFENKPLEVSVKDVKLTFTYVDGTSGTYGGYTSDSLNSGTEGAIITATLTDDGSGSHFVQTVDQTILFAGNYKTELSYTIQNAVTTLNEEGMKSMVNVPKYTVSSTAPSVAITGISLTAGASVDVDKSGSGSTGSTANGHGSATVPQYSATYAEVYFTCSRSMFNLWHNYTRPWVNITLSNIGEAESASLPFSGDGASHIYASNTDATTDTSPYTWTANGALRRYIGYWNSNTGSDGKTAAGTLTATSLELTYNGMTFTVPANITINNPY